MVTRQVVFGSGLMQVLQMRMEILWNVLSDGYKSRVATTYSGWLQKLKAEKEADPDVTEIQAKPLLGAYANCPNLFLKRCQELEHWLMEQSLWDASVIHARKVPTWRLLHTVTEAKLTKWFRDGQCLALLRPLVDKLQAANEVEHREQRNKRRRLAAAGPAKMIAGAEVPRQASDEHLWNCRLA